MCSLSGLWWWYHRCVYTPTLVKLCTLNTYSVLVSLFYLSDAVCKCCGWSVLYHSNGLTAAIGDGKWSTAKVSGSQGCLWVGHGTQCRDGGHRVSDRKQWGIHTLNGHKTRPGGHQNPRKRACTPAGQWGRSETEAGSTCLFMGTLGKYTWLLSRKILPLSTAPESSTPRSYQHVLFLNFLVLVRLKGEKDVFS